MISIIALVLVISIGFLLPKAAALSDKAPGLGSGLRFAPVDSLIQF
jgi:hypothetical protein